MGFLAKLLAPHVLDTPEQTPPSSPSPSSQPAPSPSSQAQPSSASKPQSRQFATSQSSITTPSTAAAAAAIDTSSTAHLTPLQRQVKQLGLLALGAGFMAASVAVTRRAVLRRQRESIPRFFRAWSHDLPGDAAVDSAERSTLAAQALGLATLNVASFGVLLVGGTGWAFDLCSVAELRARTQAAAGRRAGEGGGGGLLSDEEAREVDNMVVGLMERLGMDVEAVKEKEKLRGGGGGGGGQRKEEEGGATMTQGTTPKA